MKSSFSSLKRIISVGAALALLLVATPSGPDRALAGEGHHGGGGAHAGPEAGKAFGVLEADGPAYFE